MATAIYVITKITNAEEPISFAVRAYGEAVDHVVVVHDVADTGPVTSLLSDISNVTFVGMPGPLGSHRDGIREGLAHIKAQIADPGPVVLAGSHAFGPVFDPDIPTLLGGAPIFSCYWHNTRLDPRLKDSTLPERVPSLDFAVVSPDLLTDPAFDTLWQGYAHSADGWNNFLDCEVKLAQLLEDRGTKVAYPYPPEALQSAEPRFFEVDRVLTQGSPVLPVPLFFLDPLLHDLNAVSLKSALDWLRDHAPELYAVVIRFATRNIKMREFATIADQYAVLPDHARNPDKSEWSFGEVAVFIHAFYADMMPEFWALIERLPCKAHLFLTTATEDNARLIEEFLVDKGRGPEDFTVRVVEQNRGRDMSSLFITWRDVVLSGRYEVALRLHSKRTPQVARQVGESFRDHLFENLVRSPGYVSGLLDRLEAEPDIGLVIPPVIHVGFGTLGHSWFNNKTALATLAKKMDIHVPLDDYTPVAAYGTMYWFRPDALAKMFSWDWNWDEYNPEPHHIDGGLAHVQERLIGYCAQDAGYRVLQVMNTEMAARNYAKLEYKLQLFSSYLGSNNVIDQHAEMASIRHSWRGRLYKRLRMVYGAILRKFPASRRYLIPLKNATVSFLMPRR